MDTFGKNFDFCKDTRNLQKASIISSREVKNNF